MLLVARHGEKEPHLDEKGGGMGREVLDVGEVTSDVHQVARVRVLAHEALLDALVRAADVHLRGGVQRLM